MWMFVPAQAHVQKFLPTFKEFPPSQAVGSLSVEKALQKMQQASA
jgi:arylsulfatase